MGEVIIKIGSALSERLERISAESGASPEEIAISAILDRIEELEDAPVARQRLRDLEEGAAEPIAHQDLICAVGLA